MRRGLPCQRSVASRFWMRGSLITFMHISVPQSFVDIRNSACFTRFQANNLGQDGKHLAELRLLGHKYPFWLNIVVVKIQFRSFTDAYVLQFVYERSSEFFVSPAKCMLQVFNAPPVKKLKATEREIFHRVNRCSLICSVVGGVLQSLKFIKEQSP